MRPILRRSLLAGALAPTVTVIVGRHGWAAPSARLWEKWATNDPSSQKVVGQQGWADFLSRYVVEEPDGINRVRYGEVCSASIWMGRQRQSG